MNPGYRLVKLTERFTRLPCLVKLSSNKCVRSVPTMRLGQLALFSSIALALAVPAVAATRTHRTHTTASSSHKSAKRPVKAKFQSPRGIEDARATEIQTALIKAGYLSGTPSGHWDTESAAAMQKVQADNGWQTKLVPDSRALIKLGLGPASTAPTSASATAGSAGSSSADQ